MKNPDLLKLIKGYNTVSIIGMDKNSGKTTTLDYLIDKARGKLTLGLTSIGRDGEVVDRVTNTPKPKIYVSSGTLVATSKECLQNSDVTKEILKTTGISTAMGEVVIIRCLSDGYVELSGPSINYYMKNIAEELRAMGAETVLIDGAISRKTFGSPYISDGLILAAGASLSRNINEVAKNTSDTVKLLGIEPVMDEEIVHLIEKILGSSKLGVIYGNNEYKTIDVITALDCSKILAQEMKNKPKYVAIKGVISDKLVEGVIHSGYNFKNTIFVVEDGTKLFLKYDTYEKFTRMGGKIKCLKKINVIAVTSNPMSPYGYEFDWRDLLDLLKNSIDVPVFDVVGGKQDEILGR